MTQLTDEQDRDLARAYLRRLQESAFAHGAIDPLENGLGAPELGRFIRRVFGDASNEGDYEQFIRSVQLSEDEARRTRSTDLEGVGWYTTVSSMMTRLQREFTGTRLKLSHPIVLGTLPTGSVNGMAIALDNVRTKVVVLNHGLFLFCHLVSKALALALPIRMDAASDGYTFSFTEDAIRTRLAETSEPHIRLGDVLVAYVVHGSAHHARPYLPDVGVGELAWTLCESMELFVVGHELGHVVRGHHDGQRVHRSVAPGIVADVVSTAWKNEFEADYIGFCLMLRAMVREGEPTFLSAPGAHVFLRGIEAVEDTVSLLTTGTRSTRRADESHPPPSERRRFLDTCIRTLSRDGLDREAVLEVTSAFMFAFDAMFDALEPRLVELHEKGVRPTSSFRPAER